ncbi:MAG TPA: nucleotide exchange factor GrpE [Firmicutes bacterium]|nr:nucleotide exchange factor GrpE [Bacillota bacterium]
MTTEDTGMGVSVPEPENEAVKKEETAAAAARDRDGVGEEPAAEPAEKGAGEPATEKDVAQAQAEEGASVAEEKDPAELAVMLEEARRENQELVARYLRLQADFDNFRRRSRQELAQAGNKAAEKLIGQLLPVIDDLERALQAATEAGESQALITGVQMVYHNLLERLRQEGLEAGPGVGAPFDPHWHEAVYRVEGETQPEDGDNLIVLEMYRKGYSLSGKVIRPAMVKVGPASAAPAKATANPPPVSSGERGEGAAES